MQDFQLCEMLVEPQIVDHDLPSTEPCICHLCDELVERYEQLWLRRQRFTFCLLGRRMTLAVPALHESHAHTWFMKSWNRWYVPTVDECLFRPRPPLLEREVPHVSHAPVLQDRLWVAPLADGHEEPVPAFAVVTVYFRVLMPPPQVLLHEP